LLVLDDYSYRYPDKTWGLRDISFSVLERESVAIVGENGAGKSTLARCLMGISIGRGEHRFDGRLVTPKNRAELWRHMGMVFQNPSDQLFCPSCREEVAFGPKQMRLSREEVALRVQEAMHAVRLEGYEDRVPHHLSGGERKRLAIAAVLSMKPRVLILDEPTAGLDPQSEELLVDILRKLEITKILISHDMPLILALCRRTVVLHQGRIIRDYLSSDLQHDEHLVSINGLDYTYKNDCCREIIALQRDFEAGIA
jgi:energy-coupling factor transporter ATP-binding protein EcfA2